MAIIIGDKKTSQLIDTLREGAGGSDLESLIPRRRQREERRKKQTAGEVRARPAMPDLLGAAQGTPAVEPSAVVQAGDPDDAAALKATAVELGGDGVVAPVMDVLAGRVYDEVKRGDLEEADVNSLVKGSMLYQLGGYVVTRDDAGIVTIGPKGPKHSDLAIEKRDWVQVTNPEGIQPGAEDGVVIIVIRSQRPATAGTVETPAATATDNGGETSEAAVGASVSDGST